MRGERSRAQILDHAITIASTDGLEGLTIGRVATEAGVSKGNITVLFGSKEGLQIATFERAMEQFRQIIVAPALSQPTALECILTWIENWFAFVSERALPGGCFLNAVSSEYRAKEGAVHDAIAAYRAAARQRLEEWIEQARADGDLAKDTDVKALALGLLAYQSIANVAFSMGETALFDQAHETCRQLVRDKTVKLRSRK
ncbi:MAG: TetR/AcrR family transcriptional regulator [Pandoraea sp.]|nr:TetR/AcrR family transcriptional regulator [Pandoraea sp.]MDR3397585.1 TetR/AcrR family transcriptional regulator [Pandoraea sp.]